MTIKDIRRLRRLKGVYFYLYINAPELDHHYYCKNYREMMRYIKKYFDKNLVSKAEPEKKITGVGIWRKEEGRK